MRKIILLMLTAVVFTIQSVYAGVLANSEILYNGRKNLADPVFTRSLQLDSGIGLAVRYILENSGIPDQSIKIEILRAALEAQEQLPNAQASVADISSDKLYASLVMYDLVSQTGIFTSDEIASLEKSLTTVLSHYLDSDICNWEDDYWSLGASALRISASCILFAFNFSDNSDAGKYLRHGRQILEKNINESIDSEGAWTANSPGYAGEAIEYIVLSAMALRENGFTNYFSDPRLRDILLYEMHLLPPQQCPQVRNVFMIMGAGQTNPGVNHGGTAVIAATELYPYFPNEASNLIWFWNQCGNPVTPLGLLYIDTSIPYMMPDGNSLLAGNGIAVLRDDFATARESAVFLKFNGLRGISDREGNNHGDQGDFSFIWSGIPFVVHDGYVQDDYSEDIMNRMAWRHSVVQYESAGNIPIIPETMYKNQHLMQDTSIQGVEPADFYPDGINQFLTTDMIDYVVGEMQPDDYSLNAESYYRHFLFLKPDALLIWDQIESSFPLEWNLWLPVEYAEEENNMLNLYTRNNSGLHIVFAGDDSLEYEIDRPQHEKTWNWPVIMRSDFGRGTVTLLTVDLIGGASADSTGFGIHVLQNILYQQGEPGLIGIIGGDGATAEILAQLRINFNSIEPQELSAIDLSAYNIIIVDDTGSGKQESNLAETIGKIQDFARNGGNIVWMKRTLQKSDVPGMSNRGLVPGMLGFGSATIEFTEEITPEDITISDDPVWLKPNLIEPSSWFDWFSSSLPDSSMFGVSGGISFDVPVSWSDSWKVLAAVKNTFPVKTYANEAIGEPSRIRVKHPGSKDFFTLFLPRRTGSGYNFNVTGSGPGFVSFADPVTTWEVKAGRTNWTDANLSVKISRENGFPVLYAFDCTYINFESEEISSESPISIYYSAREDRGVIFSPMHTTIRYKGGSIKLHAGEVAFRGLRGNLAIERQSYITMIRTVDSGGYPVASVRAELDGRFAGETDSRGRLPVRWNTIQPQILLNYHGAQTVGSLVPGEMEFRIPVE